jgi:hypothetical protein
MGAKSRQEHSFHFFLLKTHKKFIKIAFSSVDEKKGALTRKVFISDIFREDTF